MTSTFICAKGEQHLTGDQVAGYVRFRHDAASDFGRVKRQQQVLKLMIDQLSEPQNWAKLPHILQLGAQTDQHDDEQSAAAVAADDLPQRARRQRPVLHAAEQGRVGR